MTANAEKTKLMEKLPLTQERQDWLKSTIRDINDFPKPGIVFKDLTTLMKDAAAFSCVLNSLAVTCEALKPTVVAGIEARGFILAPAVTTIWASVLCRCASLVNCPGKPKKSLTPWNTARILSKSILMQ